MKLNVLKQIAFMLVAGCVGLGIGVAIMWNNGHTTNAGSEVTGPKLEYVAQVNPTCTTPGTKAYWRDEAGKRYSDQKGLHAITKDEELVIAAQHTLRYVARDYTCDHGGHDAYYHCIECAKNFYDKNGKHEIEDLSEIALPQKAHKISPVKVPAKDATCTEEGWVAHYECTECGQAFEDAAGERPINAKIAPHHTLKKVAYTAPTCEEAGCDEHWHCTVCGKNYADENATQAIENVVIPATGHVSGHYEEEVAATCTENGHPRWFVCDKCQKHFVDGVEITDENLPEDYRAHHTYVRVYEDQYHYINSKGQVKTEMIWIDRCQCGDEKDTGYVKNAFAKLYTENNSLQSQNVVDDVNNYECEVNAAGKNQINVDVFQVSQADLDDGKVKVVIQLSSLYNSTSRYRLADNEEGLPMVMFQDVQVAPNDANMRLMELHFTETTTWQFDWDGDGNYEQTIRVVVA